jgi:hypothetical protein
MRPARDKITFLPRASGCRRIVPAAAAVHLVDSLEPVLRPKCASTMGAGSLAQPLE